MIPHDFAASLANTLLAGWHRMLAALRWVVSPLFVAAGWLRESRVSLWSVAGEERNSHLPLSVLRTLNGEDKNYVLGLLFSDSCQQSGAWGSFGRGTFPARFERPLATVP